MQELLRRLLERSKQKANRSAAGTPVPAGIDPSEQSGPTARERTLMRRRLRALRRRQEAIAAQPLEGHAHELEPLEAEARAIAEALREKKTLDELLAVGLSKRCSSCGELEAKRDPFCPTCGVQTETPAQPAPHAPAPRPAHSTAQTAVITGASSGRSPTPPAH
jgi:rubrerythrin